MHRGYIKLWRKIRDNPRMHDPDYMAVWAWCLIEATYSEKKSMFGGKEIELQPGQFTTGRRQFSELCGVQESKLERILVCFVNNKQIEQQTSNTNRLISICNWKEYQENEQQMNNKRTTDEQQVNTPKELKKVRSKIYTLEFESFWKEYPRRKDKGHAFIEWNRQIKNTDPKVIIEGAKRYAIECLENKTEERYIKMAQGWLSGQRWLDEKSDQKTERKSWTFS